MRYWSTVSAADCQVPDSIGIDSLDIIQGGVTTHHTWYGRFRLVRDGTLESESGLASAGADTGTEGEVDVGEDAEEGEDAHTVYLSRYRSSRGTETVEEQQVVR